MLGTPYRIATSEALLPDCGKDATAASQCTTEYCTVTYCSPKAFNGLTLNALSAHPLRRRMLE